MAHVLAMEKPEAAGQRFFTTAGHHSNAEVTRIIGERFPEYQDRLPAGEALKAAELPPDGQRQEFDNSRTREVLGLEYGNLETMVVDAVRSMKLLES